MDELFEADHILLDVEAEACDEVFRAVAQAAEKSGITDSADALMRGFQEREREASTGLMDGFAIPHTKSDAATRAALYYVRTVAPVTWETMDGRPVTDVFALIASAADPGNTHLSMLSALASSLLEEEFKYAVSHAETAEQLVSLVAERIEKEREQ
ncbi:PTS sugar transporter subunit IIA [Collinsella vaginalis]|uniref:PTS sugar transporter subunit IIA n=1 Tax=Collinsella vaginalis TaxID=1870987 RepID=UPI0015C51B48|nr:PTS sugar transporter subunit IIA [Collinsella vaginalis]